MYTEKFLRDFNGLQGTASKNENKTLKKLNTDPNIPNLMSSSGIPDFTAKVGLFVGRSTDTLQEINVLPSGGPDFYEDGYPREEYDEEILWGEGDGTVPYASAIYPQTQGWAALISNDSPNPHSELTASYLDEIVSFIEGSSSASASPAEAKSASVMATAFEDSIPTTLSLVSYGSVRLLVTDPNGMQTDIDSSTGDVLKEIPDSGLRYKSNNGEIGIENLVNGTYHVEVSGPSNRHYRLRIGYSNASASEVERRTGFNNGTVTSFDIQINNDSAPHMTIINPANPVNGLQADIVEDSASLVTKLSWTGTSDHDVIGYNVYRMGADDPFFTLIAGLPVDQTSIVIDDLWAADAEIAATTYVVTAVKSGGSESFFSARVLNNDRDHDLLSDAEELLYGTNLNKPDTDGDGVSDYDEIRFGTDPLKGSSVPSGKEEFPWILFMPVISAEGP